MQSEIQEYKPPQEVIDGIADEQYAAQLRNEWAAEKNLRGITYEESQRLYDAMPVRQKLCVLRANLTCYKYFGCPEKIESTKAEIAELEKLL